MKVLTSILLFVLTAAQGPPRILTARSAAQNATALFIHVGNFQRKVITFHKFSVVGVHSLLLEGIAKLEVIQLVFLHCKDHTYLSASSTTPGDTACTVSSNLAAHGRRTKPCKHNTSRDRTLCLAAGNAP